MVNKNYRINENRLQPKNNMNNKFLCLNIPYKVEVKPMLYYIHYNNNHIKHEAISKAVKDMGFYWAGYTYSIKEILKECGVCYYINKCEKIPKKPKIILFYSPLRRYQCDIWHIKGKIKANHNYEYVLDVMDHYSKWM